MPLPDHLFVSDSGDLFDTRQPKWFNTPLRRRYVGARNINTVAEFKAALRAGQHTNLGGYPLFFIMRDGCALSFEAARAEFRTIVGEFGINSSWTPVVVEINYEDPDLFCDHTGERIPSAYAEDGEEEEAA